MSVQAMAEPVFDHQKRFQAAVDVIHNLPKNGFYRPSYEMMLRFYSLYKQAVCGPCAVPRPGFWDPVGRYKWDAWSNLGEMCSESAMAAYVDEIKKVAQEVIDTMPMNEKMATLFHHFEPLYLVIDDMPRPPDSLLTLREGSEHANMPAEMKDQDKEQGGHKEDCSVPEVADPDLKFNLSDVIDLSANPIPDDSGVSEGVVVNSDSESEIYCDSVDQVEQLSNTKSQQLEGCLEVRQVGAGRGGEGAEDGKGQDLSRSRDIGQEGSYRNWRERGVPEGSLRRGAPGIGGAGQGGGYGSEGDVERLHDTQLQQQIILALRRLREDMRSVMDRLEVVERLAAIHTQSSEWRPCLHCAATASQQQEERWWPFNVSGQTILLFLVWPFVAQGLVYLLRKTHKRSRISS